MNKILLIGCGHMGSALLQAWLQQKKIYFYVVDPFNYKKINNKKYSKVKAYKSLLDIKDISSIDIVIFAIKPQIISRVLKEVSFFNFNKKTIFVSIVAGIQISFFNKFLKKNNQFIRVMPNMPALVNKGMSCLVASRTVTTKNKNKINSLFLKVGKTLWLSKEKDINIVTAISGSGPGYIFLLVDAFEKAALKLGLNEKDSHELVYQTFFGSIELLLKNNNSALKLAQNIAVSGGTTEAAFKIFLNKKILHKTFEKAINAAYKKSIKLSK